MTNPPQPTPTEIEERLYRAAWEGRGIKRLDLLKMAIAGLLVQYEDESGDMWWELDETILLTWNANQRRFVVPRLREVV